VRAEEALEQTLDQYAGRWVAVRDHSVVGHAVTLDNLLEQIKGQETEETEVFYVAEDRDTACFY
jgi:hypothetical protein